MHLDTTYILFGMQLGLFGWGTLYSVIEDMPFAATGCAFSTSATIALALHFS